MKPTLPFSVPYFLCSILLTSLTYPFLTLTHIIYTSLLTGTFPHGIQAGSGNPTAHKTYIKHFSYRKLQTCLSPSIHIQNTRMSCLQPGLIVYFTEQQTGH